MARRQGLIPLREKTNELEKIYRQAEKEITKELFSFDIGDYQEIRAMRLQKNIDRIISRLNRAAIRWVKESVPMAYKKARDVSRVKLEILGAKKNIEYPEKTHSRTIGNYENATMNDLIRANMSIKTNIATFLYLARQANQGLSQFQAFDLRDEEIIAGLLDEAMAEGETRQYAYKAIREHFRQKFGDAKYININGRNYNLRKYSQLVARTRLRHVQTEAVKNICNQYDNDLVEVSSHGTKCEICLPHEGQVYSLSGKHPHYPLFDDSWMHPRCQHSISPTSEVALEARERFG